MLNSRITKNQNLFFKILVYVFPFLGEKVFLRSAFLDGTNRRRIQQNKEIKTHIRNAEGSLVEETARESVKF